MRVLSEVGLVQAGWIVAGVGDAARGRVRRRGRANSRSDLGEKIDVGWAAVRDGVKKSSTLRMRRGSKMCRSDSRSARRSFDGSRRFETALATPAEPQCHATHRYRTICDAVVPTRPGRDDSLPCRAVRPPGLVAVLPAQRVLRMHSHRAHHHAAACGSIHLGIGSTQTPLPG